MTRGQKTALSTVLYPAPLQNAPRPIQQRVTQRFDHVPKVLLEMLALIPQTGEEWPMRDEWLELWQLGMDWFYPAPAPGENPQ